MRCRLVSKKYSIIETHAHLDMAAFDKDRTEVIARAREAGVGTIVTVGTDLESSQKAIRLAEDYPEISATVGFHPHEAAKVKKADMARLVEMAYHPKVVAIGEIGLDYYRHRSPRQAQLQALQWQLELVERLDLPVIIHCRQAEKDMLSLLNDWTSSHKCPNRRPRGVIHCFSGDIETAHRYLDMGFYISFGAYIGYPSSIPFHSVIRSIPQDKLVVETDSPLLPPQIYRGKRNEPSHLPLVIRSLADIRQTSEEAIAKETTQNARNLFRWPKPGGNG